MSRYPFKHSPRFRHGDSQALAEVGRQARNLRVAQEPSSVVNTLDSARWRFVACVLLSLSSFCDLIHSLHSVALVYAVITPVARMFLSAQATSGRSESARVCVLTLFISTMGSKRQRATQAAEYVDNSACEPTKGQGWIEYISESASRTSLSSTEASHIDQGGP